MKVEITAVAYADGEEYRKGVEIDTSNEEESMKELRFLFSCCRRTAQSSELKKQPTTA